MKKSIKIDYEELITRIHNVWDCINFSNDEGLERDGVVISVSKWPISPWGEDKLIKFFIKDIGSWNVFIYPSKSSKQSWDMWHQKHAFLTKDKYSVDLKIELNK